MRLRHSPRICSSRLLSYVMLDAGRDLDAEVAEKVMGWTLEIQDDRNDAYSQTWRTGPNILTDSLFVYEFEPSIDIAAAWQVVEYMQGRELTDFSVSWDVRNDSWCWVARFARTEATGPTAPLAICRAALAAVSQSSAASAVASPES
jgi:hypothetical protein